MTRRRRRRRRARVPGVAPSLTGADLDGVVAAARAPARGRAASPRPRGPRWPTARVRFVGEAVAVVAASTPYVAADGCERVAVGYEPLPAARRRGRGARPRARRASRARARQRARSSGGAARATWTARFARAAVVHSRDASPTAAARPCRWSRAGSSPLGGRSPHRLDRARQMPLVYPHRRWPARFGPGGEPRARDRARHRRRLRPEDARDARGPGGGRAGPRAPGAR